MKVLIKTVFALNTKKVFSLPRAFSWLEADLQILLMCSLNIDNIPNNFIEDSISILLFHVIKWVWVLRFSERQ